MKKTISFKKNIEFPSMIGEVTSISLDHTLKFIDESNISGDFKITGTYKLTEASRIEENFDYTIPVEIVLTEKLNLETSQISIEDFYYEIEDDDVMICYIDVKVEGIEEIEVVETQIEQPKIEPIPSIEPVQEEKDTRECDGDFNKNMEEENMNEKIENATEMENSSTQEETPTQENVGSLFTSLNSSEETFSTYSIYILRQEETIQSLIEKYHVSKEELENYNDLSNLTIGTKIIIPNSKND